MVSTSTVIRRMIRKKLPVAALRMPVYICRMQQTTLSTASQVRVVRGGQEVGISTYDLLVGDVLLVATGDILAADGLLFQGNELRCRVGLPCLRPAPGPLTAICSTQ